MNNLIRFVLVNTAAGGALGFGAALAISLYGAGSFAGLLDSEDRLIGLAMLAITLGPSFAAGCLGTALSSLTDD